MPPHLPILPLLSAVPTDTHVAIGWSIAGWTLVHVVAHYINYAGLPDPSVMITSAAGATGHVLLLCLALMCVAALPRFRRGKHFHIFMKVHSTGRVSNKQPACLYRTPRLLTAT